MSRVRYPIRFEGSKTRFIGDEPTDDECYFTKKAYGWLDSYDPSLFGTDPENDDDASRKYSRATSTQEHQVVLQRATILREWERRVQALRCEGIRSKMTYDVATKQLTVAIVNTEPAIYDDKLRFTHSRSLVVGPVQEDALQHFAEIVACYFCEES